jgi:hypothetical protein
MSIVQPTYFTARPVEWSRLLTALGFVTGGTTDASCAEYTGDGLLRVCGVDADDPRCGSVELTLLVSDLSRAEERVRSLNIGAVRETGKDRGDRLVVTAASGQTIVVAAAEGPRAAADAAMAVMPIWYQDDLDEPLRIVEALGLQRRLSSLDGTWIDLTAAGGGLVGLHSGRGTDISLSCEYRGDLDACAERLAAAGFAASVVDEAYNRTLLVATPDGWDLWVNGVIDDLYGYRRDS